MRSFASKPRKVEGQGNLGFLTSPCSSEAKNAALSNGNADDVCSEAKR